MYLHLSRFSIQWWWLFLIHARRPLAFAILLVAATFCATEAIERLQGDPTSSPSTNSSKSLISLLLLPPSGYYSQPLLGGNFVPKNISSTMTTTSQPQSVNMTIMSSTASDRLFRTGRETHDAFIKRILNAVSGDQPHRYVHTKVGSQRKPLVALSTEPNDLELPEEIVNNEYIDGVNPPKPHGAKMYSIVDKNDRRSSKSPRRKSTLAPPTTVTPLPVSRHGSQSKLKGEKRREREGGVSIVPPTTTTIAISTNSSTVRKLHKATVQGDAKHDLSLLLKQEFDAKNAELNQTTQGDSQPSRSTVLLRPPVKIPIGGGFLHSDEREKEISSLITNLTNRSSLLGPPYQLQIPQIVKWPPPGTKLRPLNITSENGGGSGFKWLESHMMLPKATPPTTTTTTTTTTSSTRHTTTPWTPPTSAKPTAIITKLPPLITRAPPLASTANSITLQPISVTKLSSENVFFRVKPRPLSPPPVKLPPSTTEAPEVVTSDDSSSDSVTVIFNDWELRSDESSVSNQTTLVEANLTGSATLGNSGLFNGTRTLIPSTTYRLTTERLAYILIGSCCALSIICLIIVAMSVRFKDMCDEYRSWKNAEKVALRWQRQQRLRLANTRHDFLLPYHLARTLHKGRLNLPRYFRTSIEEGKKDRFTNGLANKSTEKMLDSILSATNLPEVAHGSNNNGCCHCVNCSSTWVFRNHKNGDWCCQRGYYQPPRRVKLPFGAASSVNTFMSRVPVKSTHNDGFSSEQEAACVSEMNSEWNRNLIKNSKQDHFSKANSQTNRYFAESATKCAAAAAAGTSADEENRGQNFLHHRHECEMGNYRRRQTGKEIHKSKVANTEFYHSQCKYYFDSPNLDRPGGGGGGGKANDRSSSIWIDSSKLVDKLHRGHQNRPEQPHHYLPPLGSLVKVDECHHSHHHRNHRHSNEARFRHCGPFPTCTGAQFTIDDERNFVVWNNDTDERLI